MRINGIYKILKGLNVKYRSSVRRKYLFSVDMTINMGHLPPLKELMCISSFPSFLLLSTVWLLHSNPLHHLVGQSDPSPPPNPWSETNLIGQRGGDCMQGRGWGGLLRASPSLSRPIYVSHWQCVTVVGWETAVIPFLPPMTDHIPSLTPPHPFPPILPQLQDSTWDCVFNFYYQVDFFSCSNGPCWMWSRTECGDYRQRTFGFLHPLTSTCVGWHACIGTLGLSVLETQTGEPRGVLLAFRVYIEIYRSAGKTLQVAESRVSPPVGSDSRHVCLHERDEKQQLKKKASYACCMSWFF